MLVEAPNPWYNTLSFVCSWAIIGDSGEAGLGAQTGRTQASIMAANMAYCVAYYLNADRCYQIVRLS